MSTTVATRERDKENEIKRDKQTKQLLLHICKDISSKGRNEGNAGKGKREKGAGTRREQDSSSLFLLHSPSPSPSSSPSSCRLFTLDKLNKQLSALSSFAE